MKKILLSALMISTMAFANGLKDKVEKRLHQLGAKGYFIYEVTDASVTSTFPSDPIVAVRFRQWPIAMPIPAPLKSNNLFYDDPTGALAQVSTTDDLKSFMLARLSPQKGESAQRTAIKCWLALTGELRQDGYYTFAIPDSAITLSEEGGLTKVAGKLTVVAGGRGEISATLTFDGMGKLVGSSESGKVIPGVRPICQATKLLDKDPIVRRMAEQDLLVMGPAAREYLDYITPKLSPALKAAAAKIWDRIAAGER